MRQNRKAVALLMALLLAGVILVVDKESVKEFSRLAKSDLVNPSFAPVLNPGILFVHRNCGQSVTPRRNSIASSKRFRN